MDPTAAVDGAARAARAPHAAITLGEMLRLGDASFAAVLARRTGAAGQGGGAIAPAARAAGGPGVVPALPGTGFVPPVEAPVSSGFGPRVHPVLGVPRHHAGIDLAAPAGTPIRAAASGTVLFAGDRGGYGNLVIIDHGDGRTTRYAHQRDLAVATGDRVAAGDLLGTVGSTGMSTGPHLHFEVRIDGEAVDPRPYLEGERVLVGTGATA